MADEKMTGIINQLCEYEIVFWEAQNTRDEYQADNARMVALNTKLVEVLRSELKETQDYLSRGEWQAIDDASELREYIYEMLTLRFEGLQNALDK